MTFDRNPGKTRPVRSIASWVRRVTTPHSLRSKLIVKLLLILTLIGVVSIGGLAKLQVSKHYVELKELRKLIRENLDAKSTQLSQAHASALGILAADNALLDMQNLVQSTVENDEDVVYGAFVKRTGTTLTFSAPGFLGGTTNRDVSRSILGLTENELTRTRPGRRELQLFGKPVIEYSAPVIVGESVYGNLFYGVSIQKVELAVHNANASNARALRDSLLQLSWVMLGVTLLAIPFALRVARNLTLPIVELTRAARKLSAGQREVRVDIRSGDELEALGASFNTMVSDLDRSYAELETSNRMLQQEMVERKRAEEERSKAQSDLFQSQKMDAIGQLAGGVAHDFNNLLAVIQGNIDLIASARPDEDAREMMKDIATAVAHGATLTRQLLTFSRKQPNEPQVISPMRIVKDVQKFVRRLISERYQLNVVIVDDVPWIRMDPGRLEQVLINLTVNARDSLSNNGKITVIARSRHVTESERTTTGMAPPGEYAELVVEDNGCGMDLTTISHIFEPFFTTKATGKGTGLGLATVHGIIGEANGFIQVESELGRGTTFTILLPSVAQDDPRSTKAESIAPVTSGNGLSVMICEDEDAVRYVIARILSANGYRVTAFTQPRKLLAELEHYSAQPDLLITDVIMPELNGKELATAARIQFPNIRVLFVSGHTAGVLHDEGVDEACDWLLKKPFTARELLVKVAEITTSNSIQRGENAH